MPVSGSSKIEPSSPSRASNQNEPTPIINHPTFFFDNTLIVIQIENVRFNIHKYQLIKSKTFTDILMVAEKAKAEGQPVEGSSIDNPIILKGVSPSDFGCLLTVLYATHFSTHQPEPEASLIIPAFRLANIWDFSDLRTYLQPLAEKVLDDVDKIVLAREFDIKDWLAPAHVKLCQRPARLSIAEAEKLGINSVLMISIIREEFKPSQSSNQAQSCPGTTAYCNSRRRSCGPNHCSYCSQASGGTLSTHAVVSQAIQGKVNKWVDDKCVIKSPQVNASLQADTPLADASYSYASGSSGRAGYDDDDDDYYDDD